MKAAVFREYDKDPARVIKIEDIDTPKLKPNEVMIKVESASYNYNDLWAIWGDPVKTPLPHISGSDVAGPVVEVGEDVTKFRTGDRVVSHSNLSCRVCEMCIQEENTIVMKEIFGDFKLDHYGVDSHNILIYLKLTLQSYLILSHSTMQPLYLW